MKNPERAGSRDVVRRGSVRTARADAAWARLEARKAAEAEAAKVHAARIAGARKGQA